jgi:hypothetical protein
MSCCAGVPPAKPEARREAVFQQTARLISARDAQRPGAETIHLLSISSAVTGMEK